METNVRKLKVVTLNGTFFYKVNDIVRLQASSGYTQVFFINRKKILVPKVMKEFVQELEPFGFIRTHRSHLINHQYVSSVSADGKITMADTSVAKISRRNKNYVLREMHKSCTG